MAGSDDSSTAGGTGGRVRAVFLDRDGVINEIVRRNGTAGSPRSVEELVIRDEAPDAVRRLKEAGFRVFVVTNQPDVARGKLSVEALESMADAVRRAVPVDDYRACPHDDPEGCDCRKPKPGMLLQLAKEWDVDLSASFMVGDRWKDVEAGRAAGCRTVLLERDYSGDTEVDHRAGSLTDAVEWILEVERKSTLSYARQYLTEAQQILEQLDPEALDAMAAALAELRERGGRLFFLGVGGGAGHASHAVNDFRKIAGIEAYTPADNVAELTARINDEGWDTAFVEYLRGARLQSWDGVFVFSVGGGDVEKNISTNIVHALKYASELEAKIFGIVGRNGGYTARVADHCIVVPTVNGETVTPHTEGFQAVLWHLLVSHPALQRYDMKWESVSESKKTAAKPSL